MRDDIDNAIERVRKWLLEHPGNKKRLALESDLSTNALGLADKKSWNPRLNTLKKVIAALDRIERKGKPRKGSACVVL